jgi:hypothetical protein
MVPPAKIELVNIAVYIRYVKSIIYDLGERDEKTPMNFYLCKATE